MKFGTPTMVIKYNGFSLQIDNSKTERVNYFKCPGSTLAEHLSWNRNITLLYAKGASSLYIYIQDYTTPIYRTVQELVPT